MIEAFFPVEPRTGSQRRPRIKEARARRSWSVRTQVPVSDIFGRGNLFCVASSRLVQVQWRYHDLGVSSSPRAEVRLDDIAVSTSNTYAAWRDRNFSSAGAAGPAVSEPTAETRGDGVPNLLKYALGLVPDERVSEDQLTSEITADSELFIRFHRDSQKTDIVYLVESVPDSAEWRTVLFDSSAKTAAPNTDGDLHGVGVRMDGESRRFLRLRVVT